MILMRERELHWISAALCVWIATAVCGPVSAMAGAVRVTTAEARIEGMRQLYEATNVYAFHAPVLVQRY